MSKTRTATIGGLEDHRQRLIRGIEKQSQWIHPGYGDCDGLDDGGCSECHRVIEGLRSCVTETALMIADSLFLRFRNWPLTPEQRFTPDLQPLISVLPICEQAMEQRQKQPYPEWIACPKCKESGHERQIMAKYGTCQEHGGEQTNCYHCGTGSHWWHRSASGIVCPQCRKDPTRKAA